MFGTKLVPKLGLKLGLNFSGFSVEFGLCFLFNSALVIVCMYFLY